MTTWAEMTLNDPKLWLTIAGMLVAAGMYIGKLEHRIDVLEKQQQFTHGDLSEWVAKK